MAFLDNSGDIILDAVLTHKEKFGARDELLKSLRAMGDDEINYGTYDPNHASGSAYFDENTRPSQRLAQGQVLKSVDFFNNNNLLSLAELVLNENANNLKTRNS